MKRPVLITRAQPGAGETAGKVSALGYQPVISPVLSLISLTLPADALAAAEHLVFTSANGVRAFFACGASPDEYTAWCVGPATAAEARLSGFSRVMEGSGNAADLAEMMLSSSIPLRGRILHIANEAAGESLTGRLRAAGLEASFCPAYAPRAADGLSQEALEALTVAGCAVLIHSARAAQALAHMQAPLGHAFIITISRQAGLPLEGIVPAGWRIATAPNEEALLGALQQAAPA